MKNRTKIGIILIIPLIIIMILGLGIAFYDVQTSRVHFMDPSDHCIIPYHETVNRSSFELTLNKGEYWIFYVEGKDTVMISVLVDNVTILNNVSSDPDNDYSFEKNLTIYYVLESLYLENTSNVRILKSGEDGFYLTEKFLEIPHMSLAWFGLTITIIICIPFLIVLIWLLREDENKVQAMREIKRRRREEFKKVRFDPKNQKQVVGAILMFFLGPLFLGLVFGTIPLYFKYEWITLLRTPFSVFSIFSFIIGFNMFYDKKMLGPGGLLSFKREPLQPNGIDFFYECAKCGHFLRKDNYVKDDAIICSKCDKTIPLKKLMMIICPICSSSIFISLDQKTRFACPFCFSKFDVKSMKKKK